MRLLLCVFLCWMLCLTAQAQNTGIIISRDSLVRCVIDLRKDTTTLNKSGVPVPSIISGTGMFVAKGQDLYIVTAAHVAKSMDFSSYLVLGGKGDVPSKIYLLDLIQGRKPIWKFHKRADLAVLKLSPKGSIYHNGLLNNKFLPLTIINKDSTVAVSRDIQLTVIGFPLGIGVDRRFSPLTYRTYASSGFITMARADQHSLCEFLLLENPSVGGYSGGPVFDTSVTVINGMTATGNGTMCYGFIHGTLSDETGGKLAAVTPSYFVFDLIK